MCPGVDCHGDCNRCNYLKRAKDGGELEAETRLHKTPGFNFLK